MTNKVKTLVLDGPLRPLLLQERSLSSDSDDFEGLALDYRAMKALKSVTSLLKLNQFESGTKPVIADLSEALEFAYSEQSKFVVISKGGELSANFLKFIFKDSKFKERKLEVLDFISGELTRRLEGENAAEVKALALAHFELAIRSFIEEKTDADIILSSEFQYRAMNTVKAAIKYFIERNKPQEASELIGKFAELTSREFLECDVGAVGAVVFRLAGELGLNSLLEKNFSELRGMADRYTRFSLGALEANRFRDTFDKRFRTGNPSPTERQILNAIDTQHKQADLRAIDIVLKQNILSQDAINLRALELANFGNPSKTPKKPDDSITEVAKKELARYCVTIFSELHETQCDESEIRNALAAIKKSIKNPKADQAKILLIQALERFDTKQLLKAIADIRTETNKVQRALYESAEARNNNYRPYDRVFASLVALAPEISAHIEQRTNNLTQPDCIDIPSGMYGMSAKLPERNKTLGCTQSPETISLIIKDKITGAVFLYNLDRSTKPENLYAAKACETGTLVSGAIHDFFKRASISPEDINHERLDIALIGCRADSSQAIDKDHQNFVSPTRKNSELHDDASQTSYKVKTHNGMSLQETRNAWAINALNTAIHALAEAGLTVTKQQLFDPKTPRSFTISNEPGELIIDFGKAPQKLAAYRKIKFRCNEDTNELTGINSFDCDLVRFIKLLENHEISTRMAFDGLHGATYHDHSPLLASSAQARETIRAHVAAKEIKSFRLLMHEFPGMSGLEALEYVGCRTAFIQLANEDARKIADKAPKNISASERENFAATLLSYTLPQLIGATDLHATIFNPLNRLRGSKAFDENGTGLAVVRGTTFNPKTIELRHKNLTDAERECLEAINARFTESRANHASARSGPGKKV